MQNFKELFEAYGADYQDTMSRFMGNETMYLKFLKMLYKAVCDIVQPLRAREEREDYPLLYQAIQKEFLKVEELGKKLNRGNQNPG